MRQPTSNAIQTDSVVELAWNFMIKLFYLKAKAPTKAKSFVESSQLRRICSKINSKVHQKFARLFNELSHGLLEGWTSICGWASSSWEIPHLKYSWVFRGLFLLKSHHKAAHETLEVPQNCSSWSSLLCLYFVSLRRSRASRKSVDASPLSSHPNEVIVILSWSEGLWLLKYLLYCSLSGWLQFLKGSIRELGSCSSIFLEKQRNTFSQSNTFLRTTFTSRFSSFPAKLD